MSGSDGVNTSAEFSVIYNVSNTFNSSECYTCTLLISKTQPLALHQWLAKLYIYAAMS